MLNTANRLVEGICRFGLVLGAGATALIFALLAGSSIRRYVIGSPLAYTEELAGLLFVVTSLAAVPYGVVSGQHIRLLLAWRKLPQPLASWMAVAGDLLGVAVLWVLVRQMVAFAEYSREAGSRTEISELLLWPWMYFMPAALALLAVAMLFRALVRTAGLREGRTTSLEAGASLD
jgi:TRAP-type C4-dicarboxylate transport system permease small subunit